MSKSGFVLCWICLAIAVQDISTETILADIDAQGSQTILIPENDANPIAAHRTLTMTAVAAITNFRRIDNSGLRGFNEGGIHEATSVEQCAALCIGDKLCQSFDHEFNTCYISHADRYKHPEAFQYYGHGSYYEWQGVAKAPVIVPDGGNFSTQLLVSATTKSRGAQVYYKILGANATLQSYEADTSQHLLAPATGEIVLPEYSCKVFAYVIKPGLEKSAVVESKVYHIFAAKYGYLVPLYNGEPHGKVVRVMLDTKGQKRPRPARYHEFSNFNSPLGIGPYGDQLRVVDLAAYNSNLKGFRGGFAALCDVEYVNESLAGTSLKWRLINKRRYPPNSPKLINATIVVKKEEYSYYVPYYNGVKYSGLIARIRSATFATNYPEVQYLDLQDLDPELAGFSSAFDVNGYGFFVPYKNQNGFFGKLVRVDLNKFSLDHVMVLDLTATNSKLRGFSHAFTSYPYAYFVPYQYDHDRWGDIKRPELPERYSGLVARVNLQDFQTVEILDLTKSHPGLLGFSSGFAVGHRGYFVPFVRFHAASGDRYSAADNMYSGVIARVNLDDFQTVEVLDLSLINDELRGFAAGFAVGKYAVLVPHRNGIVDKTGRLNSGHVVRIDTTDFTPTGVSVINAPFVDRGQIPNNPDNDLRGFSGSFVSGKYGFLVPYFNGADFSGKICRVDIQGWDEVQVLDITQQDANLRGFSGGFTSVLQENLAVPLFGEYKVLPGTKTPYKFVY